MKLLGLCGEDCTVKDIGEYLYEANFGIKWSDTGMEIIGSTRNE